MPAERITVLAPRGFCAGVEVSIKALVWLLDCFGPPVYCYHEIVHNSRVVDRFRNSGVIFVNNVWEVPPNAPLMLSAHGSPPSIVAVATQITTKLVNAVCPLVTKVHRELERRVNMGYHVIYIGHRGQDEEAGTTAIAPHAVSTVGITEEIQDVVSGGRPIAILAQTTLSESEYDPISKEVEKRFGLAWTPRVSDRCYATTNRQRAVQQIARALDYLIVVGSPNSSNTMALARVAKETGCRAVLRINSAAELTEKLGGHVGITAGASAPDEIVDEIVEKLSEGNNACVHNFVSVVESEHFPVPQCLRVLAEKMRADGAAVHPWEWVGDPGVSASSVLRRLNC